MPVAQILEGNIHLSRTRSILEKWCTLEGLRKFFTFVVFSNRRMIWHIFSFMIESIFLNKKRMPIHCLFMFFICTYAFGKVFKNMLTLQCPLLHICLSLTKSPALQRTLIHSSFKPLKPILLNRYMSVPWKVWISESKWKYKHMLLKNILILLNSYSSRQDLAKKKN